MTKTHSTQPLSLTLDQGVAVISFNRPAVLNAIDAETAQAFRDAIRSVEAAGAARVLVIRGEGKAFMAGGDLAAFHGDIAAAPKTADAIIAPLNEALAAMTSLPLPVIASVHGAVAGAGFSVSLACDLAIAADNTRFTMAYARIGTSLDGSGSWFLPRLVGLRKALELALLAETINATEALHLGIVNRLAPPDALTDETMAWARRLAAGPTFAYGRIKHLLRQSYDLTLIEQLRDELASFRACAATDDFAEGLDAFFSKRPAVFSGR